MNNPYMTPAEKPDPTPACEGSYDIYDSDEPTAISLALAICGDCQVAACEFRRTDEVRTPTAFPDCGTHAAIHRHRRANEPLDRKCRDHQNAANRAYRARRAGREAA